MQDIRNDLPLLTIGRVVELSGLSARQVRYYEKKGLITPARTQGNQRLFSQEQVLVLKTIKRLLDKGYSLANVQAMLMEQAQSQSRSRADLISMDALRRSEPTSLYPLVNRARLMELLGREDRGE